MTKAIRRYNNIDHSYENEALTEMLEDILIEDKSKYLPDMTPAEIYYAAANKLEEELRNGEYGSFSDICVEQQLNEKNYKLVIWGEENDTDEKFFSVSVYRTDILGNQEEQILSTLSESENLDDLEAAVMDILQRFDKKIQSKEFETDSNKASLSNQIQSAMDRQGRGEDGNGKRSHEPSL